MQVYLLTDVEGLAGVDQPDPGSYPTVAAYAWRQELVSLLVGEVNAAVEGALEGGATEVLVCDGHGDGRNLPPERLHPAARLIRGMNTACWLPKLDRDIGALLFLGQHAMQGTPNATIAHSWSVRSPRRAWLNGRETGEIAAAMALAAWHGVPTVFISGDRAAVEEARKVEPEIVGVVVKEGLGWQAAVHLAPERARGAVREGAARALRERARYEVRPPAPPFVFRQQFASPPLGGLPFAAARWLGSAATRAMLARRGRWAPGLGVEVRVLDRRTIEHRGESLPSVLDAALGLAAGSMEHRGTDRSTFAAEEE